MHRWLKTLRLPGISWPVSPLLLSNRRIRPPRPSHAIVSTQAPEANAERFECAGPGDGRAFFVLQAYRTRGIIFH